MDAFHQTEASRETTDSCAARSRMFISSYLVVPQLVKDDHVAARHLETHVFWIKVERRADF